jgi:transposase
MKITHCKLNRETQRKLLEYFVLEMTARSAAELLNLQPNSTALFYRKIREVITHHLDIKADEVFEGPIELDQSALGYALTRALDEGLNKPTGWKEGNVVAERVAVFGMIKRGNKVYVKPVPTVLSEINSEILLTSRPRKIVPDGVVYTDNGKHPNDLQSADFYHERINHALQLQVGKTHLGGVEEFWSFAQQTLKKYNRIDRSTMPLFIKECEFRFNYGTPKEQLKTLLTWTEI